MQLSGKIPATEAPLDPVERWAPLVFALVLYGLLCVFLVQAANTFAGYRPGDRWPALLSVFRTWTFLPIHEAGHLLFMLFGRTVMLLGGSFLQIALPLVWFLLALKQRSHVAPFPLFWVGENMMDVSLYVRDAPVRYLPLLGGHKSRHDWYNILSGWNALDSAEILADIGYVFGMIICVGAIGTGLFLGFYSFFRPKPVNVLPKDKETDE